MSILKRKPIWYVKYHAWNHSTDLNVAILLISLFILFLSVSKHLIEARDTSITVLTQVINPSKLGVSVPLFITFSPILSDIAGEQVAKATIDNIIVSDTRSSTGTGWSVSILCSNFVAINQPVRIKGINDTVTSSGEYDGPTGGTYTITITQAGKTGVARFSVSGLESSNDEITGADASIGTRGVMATFAQAPYAVGDSWVIRIDTIPVSNLTVVPQGLQLLSGKAENAHVGSTHKFLDKNDPATLLVVPSIESEGSFSTGLLFSLHIPPFTYANTYKAMLTITSE